MNTATAQGDNQHLRNPEQSISSREGDSVRTAKDLRISQAILVDADCATAITTIPHRETVVLGSIVSAHKANFIINAAT